MSVEILKTATKLYEKSHLKRPVKSVYDLESHPVTPLEFCQDH